jgi:APA family basic amino acid/polyamine antiporter
LSEQQQLKRSLTFIDLFAFGVAALIGTGIFVLTGIAAGHAGPALFLSFAIAGVIAILTALSYAELSSIYPTAGASYVYCRKAFSTLNPNFGHFISAIVGWTLMSQYLAVGAAVWLGFGLYARFFVPQLSVTLWGIILGVFTVGLLYRGMVLSKRVINILTVFKVLALLLFVVIGFAHPHLPIPIHQKPFMPAGVAGLLAGAAIIAFGQIHIDAVTTVAEEAINPHDVPRATVAAIALVVVFYLLVGWVIVTLVPSTALPTLKAPLASALEVVTSGWAATFVAAAGLAATITAGLACIIGAPRVGLAMAREGQFWSAFANIHPKYRSPATATLVCGIFALALTLTGNLALVASAGVFTALVIFTVVNISVIILRYTRKDEERSFKIPFGIWVPIIAIIGIIMEMRYLSTKSIEWGSIWLLTGVGVYFLFRKNSQTEEKTEDKSEVERS